MNVFEALLTDLKEDNLLEDTVLEERPPRDEFDLLADDVAVGVQPEVPADFQLIATDDRHVPAETNDVPVAPKPEMPPDVQVVAAEARQVPAETNSVIVTRNDEVREEPEVVKPQPQNNGGEFFKKRAVAEISSLQMVEHVLTGVEREYMKVKPQGYDDLKAKLALNKFLKVADDEAGAEDQRAAELELMHETEAWCTALAVRDEKVLVSSLRQYCENTNPPLSSQALLSLCRFYRNLPCNESTRAKYDFLITRLFTRAVADDTRVCLFGREEAIKHLENLYKDWASVPLYAADDDNSKVVLTALSFDDLAQESEQAPSFDELIESDFFGRLRMFKESIAELFFAPPVAIAAIEANVRIGNAYVQLIAAARQKMDAASIQAKYGELDHESVSDATARTLRLVELLKTHEMRAAEPEPEAVQHRDRATDRPAERTQPEPVPDPVRSKANAPGFLHRLTQNAFAVNKLLLVSALLLVTASVGIYVWANYFVEESVPATGVRVVGTDNPVIREHLKTAKVSNDILYGVLNETWDIMPKDKRAEYVQRLLAQGPELGYGQVNLMNKDGKRAAYGSKDKIDIEMP